MKHLLLFTISLTSSLTWAFPNLGNCPPGGANNFEILKKIAVMGSDERMTFEAYARSKNLPLETIQKKFAATGSLVCAGFRSTAQITGKNNVITTAGHAFHLTDCRTLDEDDLQNCYYIHNPGPNETYFDIKRDSIKFGGCEDPKSDWGVAVLKRPIKGVKPYLPPEQEVDIQPGTNVVMAAGSNANFIKGDRHPRTLTDCRIRDVTLNSAHPLRTDCDSGGNSSGGAQLIETEKGLQILSINIGRPNTSNKLPIGTPYDKDNYYNVAVPLAGDFLKAVRETMANAK